MSLNAPICSRVMKQYKNYETNPLSTEQYYLMQIKLPLRLAALVGQMLRAGPVALLYRVVPAIHLSQDRRCRLLDLIQQKRYTSNTSVNSFSSNASCSFRTLMKRENNSVLSQ